MRFLFVFKKTGGSRGFESKMWKMKRSSKSEIGEALSVLIQKVMIYKGKMMILKEWFWWSKRVHFDMNLKPSEVFTLVFIHFDWKWTWLIFLWKRGPSSRCVFKESVLMKHVFVFYIDFVSYLSRFWSICAWKAKCFKEGSLIKVVSNEDFWILYQNTCVFVKENKTFVKWRINSTNTRFL